MKRNIGLVVALACAVVLSACSQSERMPTGPTATGAKPQAFSIADQPPIGNVDISRPTDAPTEFVVYENSAGTGLVAEWRKRHNAVRWQWEITRHDPTDQPFSAVITVDVRPAYEWIVPLPLRNRVFNHRVRAAWPDGAVSAWSVVREKGVGSRPVSILAPVCWDWQRPREASEALLPTCAQPLG